MSDSGEFSEKQQQWVKDVTKQLLHQEDTKQTLMNSTIREIRDTMKEFRKTLPKKFISPVDLVRKFAEEHDLDAEVAEKWLTGLATDLE
jgi:hypothetical protein